MSGDSSNEKIVMQATQIYTFVCMQMNALGNSAFGVPVTLLFTVLALWVINVGRALEELRGVLYSELRTSEGAKRQQQRLCGPAVAMTFNFLVAVGIIMANKLVMGKVGFNFPIYLTLIHYSSAWVLLAIFKAFSLLPASPPSKTTPFSSLFSLGVVMAFASGLANTSLKHNSFLTIKLICSVGFYQMAKIAVTPTIVLAEFVLFRKTVTFNKILALAVVSVGVAVATVTDLEFNLFGACVAVAWIIPTLMPWLDPPGGFSFVWNLGNSSAVLISALLGFLLQWSGALALGATSATSHVVLGQFKTCVILLGGYVLFDSDPGFVSICGAVTALLGMSIYTSLNLKESQESSSSNQTPKQSSSALKPKSTEDTTEETNVKDDSNVV
ncbi:hypothetical protein C3L33_09724, partial [Rhododendron williamsianum]